MIIQGNVCRSQNIHTKHCVRYVPTFRFLIDIFVVVAVVVVDVGGGDGDGGSCVGIGVGRGLSGDDQFLSFSGCCGFCVL